MDTPTWRFFHETAVQCIESIIKTNFPQLYIVRIIDKSLGAVSYLADAVNTERHWLLILRINDHLVEVITGLSKILLQVGKIYVLSSVFPMKQKPQTEFILVRDFIISIHLEGGFSITQLGNSVRSVKAQNLCSRFALLNLVGSQYITKSSLRNGLSDQPGYF